MTKRTNITSQTDLISQTHRTLVILFSIIHFIQVFSNNTNHYFLGYFLARSEGVFGHDLYHLARHDSYSNIKVYERYQGIKYFFRRISQLQVIICQNGFQLGGLMICIWMNTIGLLIHSLQGLMGKQRLWVIWSMIFFVIT